MATSGKAVTTTIASGSTPNSRFYFKWELKSQDIKNNTSTIDWWAGWEGTTGAPSWGSNAIKITEGEIVVAGVAVKNIGTITASNQSGQGEHSLLSGTTTITHNADGSGTIKAWMTGWFYDTGSFTLSESWALTTIPRASSAKVSSDSIAIGSSQTVTITRASTDFTHTLEWSVNGTTLATHTKVATSQAYTIPADAAKSITTSTSGTCTVTVKTMNGSTQIGTTTVSFTVTVPDNDTYKPSYTATLSKVDGSVPSSWGVYVQGYSRWKVAISSVKAGANASLASWSVSDGANTGGGALTTTSADYTSNVLASTGKVTIKVCVTDSRGRTTSQTLTIDDVKAYAQPTITPQVAYRVNSSGTKTFNGTYASIQASWAYASVASKNAVTVTLEYKTLAATTWTSQSITLTSGTRATVGAGNLSATSSYNIRLTVKDGLGKTAQYTWQVGTAQVDLDFREDKKGMGIGCVGETADTLEIGWAVNLQKGLKTPLPVAHGGTGATSIDAALKMLTAQSAPVDVSGKTLDLNTYIGPNGHMNGWLYSTSDAGTANITNKPKANAFILEYHSPRNVAANDYATVQRAWFADKTRWERWIVSGTVGAWERVEPYRSMNGSWYEERLGDNFYRWTQLLMNQSVKAANQFVSGTNYYSNYDLPTKPSGATITSVHVNATFTSDTGRLVVSAAPAATLTVWQYRIISIGYEMSSAATANVEVVAYGTK